MLGFIKSFFKSKIDKDVTELTPFVDAINARFSALQQLSDDELRGESARFKARIAEYISEIEAEYKRTEANIAEAQRRRDVAQQEVLYQNLDALRKKRNEALEEVLLEILPEAFAVVKETARRLTQQGELVVRATAHDHRIRAQRQHYPIIEGEIATWPNTWPVSGTPTTWNMIHYDVQLMGGVVLHQGKIAEMATGEGKTLVSTLPVYLNALAGQGVHLVTVNDYLARRDSEWNAPLFEFHGLTVDCIDNHPPNTEHRKAAYLADITYGTNNEFGFDYLRDNMVTDPEYIVQRAHHYAIVDEVDSVLIDDARTPLIISGPQSRDDSYQFIELKPRVERLVQRQRQLCTQWLNQARLEVNRIKAGEKDKKLDPGLHLLRCHRAMPKYKPLIKFLSEDGIRDLLLKTENYYMQDKSKNMHLVDAELYFVIDEKNNQIELTDKGVEVMTQSGEDPNFFVLPDIAMMLNDIDSNPALTDAERAQQKETLARQYAEKSERLHSVQQLLKAYTLFENEVDYIVQEGKVMIVDENTGRIMHGRRYSDGLHQAIEAKENVKVEAASQTFATVTLQNFFRMYHKLAGMTGTAETEANEFYDIYKLDVVVIPTNRPIQRKDYDDKVYRTAREKFNAIIDEIQSLTEAGRPVLVGTTSVEVSELLSRMLKLRKIEHNVLNAKQHAREAEIVAIAGQAGRVTIATNMAGRGTDIKLGEGVREAGGLAIIGSERHDSRRIDRQLRGRAGRQGDPGSSQFFVSLEDDLMRLFNAERINKIMKFMKVQEGEVIQHPMITKAITNAQKKVEENNFGVRKRLLEYDDVMNTQREGVYTRRRNALFGDRIKVDLDNMLYDLCQNIASKYANTREADSLQLEVLRFLALDPKITQAQLDEMKVETLTNRLYERAAAAYAEKEQRINTLLMNAIRNIRRNAPQAQVLVVDFTDGVRMVRVGIDMQRALETEGAEISRSLEKTIMLATIDDKWKNHLREMDELKTSVQMASFEQKDPILIYKFEAYELFQRMLLEVNQTVLSMLFKAEIAQQEERAAPDPVKRDDFSRLRAGRNERPAGTAAVQASGPAAETARPLSRRERRLQERQSAKKR